MTPPQLIGQSETFLEVLDQVSIFATVNRPVIIIGERGTGKELIAARLHYLSERWDKPYLTLNCAALNENLLESELFGHDVGSFTGATKQRKGRFELAHLGSLFLDELANLPMTAQEKLLRVLEYGQFERLGSNQKQNVDVRLIAATNVDLPHMASEGKFRQDLLDRLSFGVITLPPLRERQSDILLLAEHFALSLATELSLPLQPSFTKSVLNQLLCYDWPGNVRQLKNVIERAVLESSGAKGQIDTLCLDPFNSPWRPITPTEKKSVSNQRSLQGNFNQLMAQQEGLLLREGMEHNQHNQRRCADYLGLSYDQLRGLLKKHPEIHR